MNYDTVMTIHLIDTMALYLKRINIVNLNRLNKIHYTCIHDKTTNIYKKLQTHKNHDMSVIELMLKMLKVPYNALYSRYYLTLQDFQLYKKQSKRYNDIPFEFERTYHSFNMIMIESDILRKYTHGHITDIIGIKSWDAKMVKFMTEHLYKKEYSIYIHDDQVEELCKLFYGW